MADNETLETFQKSLISKFECPVCFKYMHPPIRQCVSGHSYCTSCFENIENCALCRAEKSPNRCILLEQIHDSLAFPCKYVDEGCSYSEKCDTLTVHQEYCEFSTVLCPLRKHNDCKWTGLRSKMIDHSKTEHPGNIFFRNVNIFVDNYKRSTGCYILVYIHDTLFRFSLDFNKESGLIRWAAYSLGKPSLDKTFRYRITFLKNKNKEAVCMSGPCYQLKNEDESHKFIGKKYLVANFDMIKDLVDNDGNIYCTISISIDQNLVLPQTIEIEGVKRKRVQVQV
uniref:RING-type E3 ubiquitin transferase n=1 Tax=Diabrotica virgifera virgifera TaxID=50390 RepID=A0A6P7FK55_DIAVI